jgi:uncharacterized protein (TIGR02646 family)
MIKVLKAPEPVWFNDWKSQKIQNKHTPPDNPIENNKVLVALVSEQGGLCCYCGAKITPDAIGGHQEHFKPRRSYPELEYEYGNLHASCNSKFSCGIAKGERFDEGRCISPLDVEESRFIYTMEGEIHPRDLADAAAEYMIDILKLNARPLVGQRKLLLSKVVLPVVTGESAKDRLEKLRAAYQERDASDSCQEFRQVLTCYIGMQA